MLSSLIKLIIIIGFGVLTWKINLTLSPHWHSILSFVLLYLIVLLLIGGGLKDE